MVYYILYYYRLYFKTCFCCKSTLYPFENIQFHLTISPKLKINWFHPPCHSSRSWSTASTTTNKWPLMMSRCVSHTMAEAWKSHWWQNISSNWVFQCCFSWFIFSGVPDHIEADSQMLCSDSAHTQCLCRTGQSFHALWVQHCFLNFIKRCELKLIKYLTDKIFNVNTVCTTTAAENRKSRHTKHHIQ